MAHLQHVSLVAVLGLITGCVARPAAGSPQYDVVATAPASPRAAAIQDSVRAVLTRALRDSAFPAAVAIVGNRQGELAQFAIGHVDWAATSPAADRNTIWDMASLTKVMATTSAIMHLVDAGRIDVDAPVQRYFPEWTGPRKELVTVRHLITHTSGLPSFKPYDQQTKDAARMAELMFATPLDSAPGAVMIYSDIGAYMAGRIVEKVSGLPLDQYAARHIFAPLGMTSTSFNPSASLLGRIAPTEIDPIRGGKVHGTVHDERAYYLGGVSAHAGLFSSAADLSRFARMMLNGGTLDGRRIFSAAIVDRFTAFADRPMHNRGLGWQKPSRPGMRFGGGTSQAWAGRQMSDAAFGHTGFTGTSLAIDPENDIYILLLTNRVNPSRSNSKIGGVRNALANAVMSVLLPPPTSPPTRPETAR